MPLSAGDQLGPYKILASIGAGGMGEVYRAQDAKLGRDMALKVLPAEMAHDPERLARFHREAKALAQLDHPNIVTIHSVEECNGVHFLTMQLVEGRSLDRVIPASGLPLFYLPTYLATDARIDSLRSDPRFVELRKRVGLPE